MGWFDDVVDAASDAVSDVGSSIEDAAESVGSAAVDVAGSAGGYVGGTVGALGSAADALTGGAASSLFNAVDDTVFDTVNYVTDGAVNLNFDDGRFSASVGIPGVADVSASIGENGVTAGSSTLLGSTDVGLTDQGFQFDSSGGIDWGPLPYYDGHVSVGANGDVSVNGHVQGTVPTPYGILSGQATAGFESTDQGWGTSLDANGTLLTESGVTIGAGVQAGYMESGDDSRTVFGVEGSVSEPGVGTIGGSFGYQSTTHDGVTVSQEQAEAHASGYGVNLSAGESYVGIDTPQGSASHFDSGYDVSGPTVDGLEKLGNQLAGDDVLGTGTASSAPAGAPGAGPALGDDDVLMGPGGGAAPAPAGDAGGFGTAAPASGGDSWDAAPDAGGGFDAAPPDAGPPVDAFDQSVGAADQMQSDLDSMTDNLTTPSPSTGDDEP